MAETLTVGVSVSGVGSPVSKTKDISGDSIIAMKFVLPAAATNQEQQVGFDAAAVKAVVVVVGSDAADGTADPDGAVTLKTNSTGSPGHTKAFAAGGEICWTSRSPETNPFGTTDVTTTFWTNAGTVDTTVVVRVLVNS